MREPVTVREARPDDADAIARVAEASWRDTYTGLFEPAFIDDFLARAYAPEALRQAAARSAADPDGEFLVAERAGAVVGYLQFGIGPRGAELARLYADPNHYGTGVGSALLGELHRRIAGRVDAYVLDVHSGNARGRAFYERNGFVPVEGESGSDGWDVRLRRELTPQPPVS